MVDVHVTRLCVRMESVYHVNTDVMERKIAQMDLTSHKIVVCIKLSFFVNMPTGL